MEQVRTRPTLVAGALALAALVITAHAASAQTPPAPATRSTVQPTITGSWVYDDNVFAQPTAAADQVLRVTPGLSLIRVRPKMVLTGVYSIDAERYQQYTDLTTPNARQDGFFSALFNPTTRRSWTVNGAYYSTTNPAELNTITALTVGRQRADRWQSGAMFHQAVARQTTLDLTYTGTHDSFASGNTIGNAFDVRFGHHPSPHAEYYVKGDARRFDFGLNGGRTISNELEGGWMWRGRDAHLNIEGGATVTDGQFQSTGMFSLGRRFGLMDLSGIFGRDITTAVGYLGSITADHVDVSLTRTPRARVPSAEVPGRQPPGIRFAIHAGATRNVFPTGELLAYRFGFDFAKPVAPTLLFLTRIEATMQDNTNFALRTTGGDIIRNRVVVSLQYSPWSVR